MPVIAILWGTNSGGGHSSVGLPWTPQLPALVEISVLVGELRASAAVVADLPASATVVGQEVLTFEDGEARFADA